MIDAEMHLQVAVSKTVACWDPNLSFRAVRDNVNVSIQRLNKVRDHLGLPRLAPIRLRSQQEAFKHLDGLQKEGMSLKRQL